MCECFQSVIQPSPLKKRHLDTHTSTIRPPTTEPGSAEDAAETQAWQSLYVRSGL